MSLHKAMAGTDSIKHGSTRKAGGGAIREQSRWKKRISGRMPDVADGAGKGNRSALGLLDETSMQMGLPPPTVLGGKAFRIRKWAKSKGNRTGGNVGHRHATS